MFNLNMIKELQKTVDLQTQTITALHNAFQTSHSEQIKKNNCLAERILTLEQLRSEDAGWLERIQKLDKQRQHIPFDTLYPNVRTKSPLDNLPSEQAKRKAGRPRKKE